MNWKDIRLTVLTAMGVFLIALVLTLATGTQAEEEKEAKKEEKKITHLYGNHNCPVSDGKVAPDSFYLHADKESKTFARVYLCCEGCADKVEENIADLYKTLYLTDPKTGKENKPLDLANKECPVSGGEIDPDAEIQYNGMRVGLCCDGCRKTFVEDPEKYLAKVVPEDEAKKFKFKAGKGSHSSKDDK